MVRVLKGAHAGAVGDIKVMEDGSFISGGLDDDSEYIPPSRSVTDSDTDSESGTSPKISRKIGKKY